MIQPSNVLVIENRLAASVFNEFVTDLPSSYRIGWFVFNKLFMSRSFRCDYRFDVNHEEGRRLDSTNDCVFKKSRSHIYFGININYGYYRMQIAKCLDDFNPAVVIGECTQFYEIIIIEECIKRKILYVNPMTARYPYDSIEFNLYDTDYCFTYKMKNKMLGDRAFNNLIESIKNRSKLPTYMTDRNLKLLDNVMSVIDKIKYYSIITFSSIFVESVITPSLMTKLKLFVKTNISHYRIKKTDFNNIDMNSFPSYLLYAMQLQPENNIDIWGYPFTDQAQIIDRLAKVLHQHNLKLVVKPNPIRKYQVNERLVSSICHNSNVYYATENTDMSRLLDNAAGVVGVTGTVIIEATAKGKPVFALANTRMSSLLNIPILESIEEIDKYLLGDLVNSSITNRYNLKAYLSDCNKCAYPGVVYNPLIGRKYRYGNFNKQKLGNALQDLLKNFDNIILPEALNVRILNNRGNHS